MRRERSTMSGMQKTPRVNPSSGQALRRRSSLFVRLSHANDTVDSRKLWGIGATIALILVTVHSLAYFTVEYGMTNGENEYSQYTPAQMCMAELKDSRFDLLNTDDYYKWMDESSSLTLAQTGTYQGPDEIKEYADFIKADFFDFIVRRGDLIMTPIQLMGNECTILFTTTNKVQTKPGYGNGQLCYEHAIGYSMHYSTNPFKIAQINLYYPEKFLSELSGKALNTDGVRDYVCNVMESNCQETFELNNLTPSTCRSKYDDLPSTNTQGYLDDNSKGCRILHSAFAAINEDHCPHLSFIPEEDAQGRIKCHKSKETKPSDIFSPFELEKIKQLGHEWGFDETLMRTCPYEIDFEVGEKIFPSDMSFSESVPTEFLNDYQFQVYAGFIMYATMVLSGLGMEYLVWRIMLNGEWDHDKENKWRVVQFAFPILVATSIGLANTGNFLAMPFLVIAVWKMGFPETLMLFYAALYQKNHSRSQRFVDFITGAGTAVHHSSSALYVAMLLTHVMPSTRDVVAVTLPLVMQHWVVLLRYNYKVFYIVFEVVIEAWWEWTVFSVIHGIHEIHWIGSLGLMSMLFAHWCYFGAGMFALIALRKKGDHDIGHMAAVVARDDFQRFSIMERSLSTRRFTGAMDDVSDEEDIPRSRFSRTLVDKIVEEEEEEEEVESNQDEKDKKEGSSVSSESDVSETFLAYLEPEV